MSSNTIKNIEMDKKTNKTPATPELPECNICFEPIITTDKIKTLKCNHFYHKQCIKLWFKTTDNQCHIYDKKHSCPYCRT